jgi:hypothetical protein
VIDWDFKFLTTFLLSLLLWFVNNSNTSPSANKITNTI